MSGIVATPSQAEGLRDRGLDVTPVGKENTYGTCVGRVKAGPMSYARFTTDDRTGRIRRQIDKVPPTGL